MTTYTWKIVYNLPSNKISGGNIRAVAFVEAVSRGDASTCFQRQYAGQYFTIYSIEKVG
jgi:hypothetical protein